LFTRESFPHLPSKFKPEYHDEWWKEFAFRRTVRYIKWEDWMAALIQLQPYLVLLERDSKLGTTPLEHSFVFDIYSALGYSKFNDYLLTDSNLRDTWFNDWPHQLRNCPRKHQVDPHDLMKIRDPDGYAALVEEQFQFYLRKVKKIRKSNKSREYKMGWKMKSEAHFIRITKHFYDDLKCNKWDRIALTFIEWNATQAERSQVYGNALQVTNLAQKWKNLVRSFKSFSVNLDAQDDESDEDFEEESD
jgi:hypothetical protein